MTLSPARDLFADALSFPSIFDREPEPAISTPAGATLPDTGAELPTAGTPLPETGTALAETGTTLAQTGTALAETGTKQPEAGTALAQTGTALVETGTKLTDAGTALAGAGVPEAVGAGGEVTFADLGLPRRLVQTLAREGITAPFPIQAATVPDALAGRDVLGRGRTGSGKTLAFGLPLLVRVADAGKAAPGHPTALILVPTRELAMQVNDALTPLARALGLFSRTALGGAPYDKQIRDLRRGVDVLVATPGRLGDLIERGECSLDGVQVTVLDEADQMADMGFLPDVTALLEKTPERGQRLLFSATLDGDVDALVKQFLHDPVTHEVDPASATISTMAHHLLLIPPAQKDEIIASIGARNGRTIMFVRTQMAVDRLAGQLTAVGVRAAGLHGGKTQRVRTRTLAEFREGRTDVLVATDVAARGIHVDGVSLVVHIDPPRDSKDYLHRAGRTARAGESGTVVTLVMPRQRRSAYSMLERAGVTPERTEVRLGSTELAGITGAGTPSGVPVRDEPPVRAGERPGRPPRGDRASRDGGGYPHRGEGSHRPGGERGYRRPSGSRSRFEHRASPSGSSVSSA